MGTSPEPSKNDLNPIVPAGREREPMLIIDTSGSMVWPAADGSSIERRAVVGEAMGRLVELLGAQDSQAEAEAAAGEDAGGVMTITFAEEAECIEDLSPANWRKKWEAIVWGGGTKIMTGWTELVDTFLEEFGDRPKEQRPAILALIVTDGEASDIAAFNAEMSKIEGETYVVIAVVGFGSDHDTAYASYQQVAAANDHVRVLSFDSVTDPSTIANELLAIAS